MRKKSEEVKLQEESERFWGRVDKTTNPDGCWIWKGTIQKNRRGYGLFHIWRNGKWRQIPAHVYAFIDTFGPIERGLIVRHFECDNPPCVRPSHLAKGTHQDNSDDMVRKGRQSHGEKHTLALMNNRPRGENHYLNKRPELRLAGERNTNAKISDAHVAEIRAAYVPRKVSTLFLAKKYGISQSQVWNIIHGVSRISYAHTLPM